MKLFITILLFIPFYANSQITQISNFYVNNSDVIYIKVFDVSDTTNLKFNITKQLKSTANITNIQEYESYLTADISNMAIDYKKHGGSSLIIPMIVTNGINGKMTVDFKNGKYRVTIQGIEFINNLSIYTSGIEMEGSNQPMKNLILNKERTEIKNTKKWLDVLGFLDKHFVDTFTFKSTSNIDIW
jgi:hypothetical protein